MKSEIRWFDALRKGIFPIKATGLLALLFFCAPAAAQDPVATYLFNDSLEAKQPGVPALISVDPLGRNRFEEAMICDRSRRVFHFDGNAEPPEEQAGLSLNTADLAADNNYTVEMVFQFFDRPDEWRRILDVQNRQFDPGFYVGPDNLLWVWPVATGSSIFTNKAFHHVVLTVAGSRTVKAYLDGTLELVASTDLMNISDNLLNFFLDDFEVTGEYSTGLVALIRLYRDVLTDDQVAALARNLCLELSGSAARLKKSLRGTAAQAAEATQPTQAKCAPPGSDPSNVVEAQSVQATSGEMCEPEFTGFCHCGCGAEPDCNTDADCGGGSTCDEFISCC